MIAGADLRQASDLAGDIEVEEEVLAKALLGQKAVFGEGVAQGRELVEGHQCCE